MITAETLAALLNAARGTDEAAYDKAVKEIHKGLTHDEEMIFDALVIAEGVQQVMHARGMDPASLIRDGAL